MKRLTWREDPNYARRMNCRDCLNSENCKDIFDCSHYATDRLATIEDILDDDYDLDHLRKLVQADREGRCVIYPKEGVLNKGDRVWYVDIERGVLESGTVFIAEYKDGKLDSFSVNFDSGDFDEFLGVAWGDCILGSKKSAEEALRGEKHG